MIEQEPILEFKFPRPPEYLPQTVLDEAKQWRNLNDFDLQVKLEEHCHLEVEVAPTPLSPRLWAFTYSRPELSRCRIFINNELPLFWQRFALFHEIHHLLKDQRGCYFWAETGAAMSRFEAQADLFAWAVVLPQWHEGAEW